MTAACCAPSEFSDRCGSGYPGWQPCFLSSSYNLDCHPLREVDGLEYANSK